MNKNKKLKNKKRYLGNPFTVAFLPVLASVGLTLGATSLTMKSKNADIEIAKQHDIEIVQPEEPEKGHNLWTISCESTKAKKGDTVVFHARKKGEKNKNDIEEEPVGVNINGTTYPLDSNFDAHVKIDFVSKMTATLAFPQPKHICTVIFNANNPAGETHTVTVVYGDTVDKPLDPQNPGYKFLGWYKDGESQPFDFSTPIKEDNLILVAHWQRTEEDIPHTISLTQPSISDWILSCTTPTGELLAKKGDTVTFKVKKNTELNIQLPHVIKLYCTDDTSKYVTYPLSYSQEESAYEVVTTVPYAENMTVSVEFAAAQLCTVSFDTKGGSAVESILVEGGELIPAASIPTTSKEGYTFDYWCDDAECQHKFEYETTPIYANTVLYAKFTIHVMNVQFFDEDKTTELGSPVQTNYGKIPVYKGDEPTKPQTEEFTYKFAGWEDENGDKGLKPVIDTTQTIKYYATYAPTTRVYTVQYDTNGGSSVPSAAIEYNNPISVQPTPTKPGFDFSHWEDENGNTWLFGTSGTPVKGDTKLYAKWTNKKYTATFRNYDDTTTLQEIPNLIQGDIPQYTEATPTKPDEGAIKFTFKGWKMNGKETIGVNPIVDADQKYLPTFTSLQHTVKFETNGGSYIPAQLIEHGETIAITPVPTRTGYKLDGWYYDDGGEQKQWMFGDTPGATELTKVNDNVTLTAKWTAKQYNIKFMNGSTELKSEDFDYDSKPVPPTEPTQPESPSEKKTYKFKGWQMRDSETFGIQTVKGAAIYDAIFDETDIKHTVSFNTNGAKSYIAPVSVIYKESLDAPTTPEKDGYTFDGWYKEEALQNKWTFKGQEGTPDTVTKDITLYAKWIQDTYTIKFYPDEEGTETPIKTQNLTFGQLPTEPATKPTKPSTPTTSFEFIGWKLKGSSEIGILPASKDATEYVPYFNEIPKPCKISFESNGGTSVETVYISYGKTISTPSVSKTCYTLDGWYTESTFENQWNFSTPVTGDMTLYAKWSPNIAPVEAFTYSNDGTALYGIDQSKCGMTDFFIPSNGSVDLTTIGNDSQHRPFSDNTTIKNIILPDTVTTIYGYSFCRCSNLESINLENVAYIGQSCFEGEYYPAVNVPLKKFIIGPKIYFVGLNAFSYSKIETIDFMEYSTNAPTITFRDYSFSNCKNLTKVRLPNRIQALGRSMFGGCSSLTSIYFEGTTGEWDTAVETKTTWRDSSSIKYVICSDGIKTY